MAPREIWCNEAQERYVLAIRAERPRALRARSASASAARSPSSGRRPRRERLVVADPHFGNPPVDMDLDVLLGKPPKMTRDATHVRAHAAPLDLAGVTVRDAAYRVLQLPAVADKTFLVTIGDRTVGGLCARDPMVGPWQVPVADVAVDADGFRRVRRRGDGHRRAHAARADRRAGVGPDGGGRGDHQHRRRGHRAARPTSSSRRTGWRRPGIPARTRRSTTPCARWRWSCARRSASAFRSARTRCRCARRGATGGVDKAVTAPVSLIVTAFAPRAGRAARADAACCRGTAATRCCSGSISARGKRRLGGSALAQVYGQLGDDAPDLDDPARLAAFFATVQALAADGRAARLSRHRRRRTVRDACRDGVRVALRSGHCHRRDRRRSAGGAVRRGARGGRPGACRGSHGGAGDGSRPPVSPPA